jgi:4-amino-4-deoxy-L-arabinose transferase-like glycosyltransferase
MDALRALVLPVLAVCALGPVDAWQRRASRPLDGATRLAAAFALALGWLELGGVVLGFSHTLRAPFVIGWTAIGAAAALGVQRPRLPRVRLSPWLAIAAVAACGYAAMASYPPWDRDEMVYHLALPRAFARAGGYVRPDDNIFASMPLGYESALALLHALGGPPDFDAWFNPRLAGVACAMAAALATAGLARTLGARSSAPLASVMVLLAPSFVEVGSSAYVEPALVLTTTLATTFAARSAGGDRASAVAAAALAAMAMSTKYPGLGWTAILAAALVLDVLGRDPEAQRAALGRAATFVAVAFALGAPFYVRNLVERHNPVFPMAYDVFGGLGWDDVRADAYWSTLRAYGAGDGIAALGAAVRVLFARDFVHGFEGSVGPVFALGAAAGAWLLVRPAAGVPRRPIALVVITLAGFAVLFTATVAQARFFLAAIPLLAALLAVGVDAKIAEARRPPVRAGLVAVCLAWGAGGYAHLWTRQPTWAWIRGRLPVGEALAAQLPESYVPMRALEALVPPSARIQLVWMRGYTYYLRRDYRLDAVFEEWRLAEALERAHDPADLARALRAAGVTHLLVNEQRLLRDGSSDTAPGRTVELRRRWEGAVAGGAVVPRGRWGSVVLYEIPAT